MNAGLELLSVPLFTPLSFSADLLSSLFPLFSHILPYISIDRAKTKQHKWDDADPHSSRVEWQ